ncbi:MAG TPA: class I SAM-dependent methyltransferase [Magnetovibrio sp.]
MTQNIVYKTQHLADYFLGHRRTWDEFYPSERWVFERIGASPAGFGKVLDVGCAVGGLGNALTEKFQIASYTGMDINAQAIDAAKCISKLPVPSQFLCADIVHSKDVEDEAYDTVAALSVADWNVDTFGIIEACWRKVAPGGRLIISVRLTELASTLDAQSSYQYIVPGDDFEMPADPSELEKAPYVVLNAREALAMFANLTPAPSDMLAYGYWGTPSATAHTPYDRLAFAVLSIQRANAGEDRADTRMECHLPLKVLL